MEINIKIIAEDLPLDYFSRISCTDSPPDILGIQNLQMQSQNFSSAIGNVKLVNIEYIQKKV